MFTADEALAPMSPLPVAVKTRELAAIAVAPLVKAIAVVPAPAVAASVK